MRRTLERLDTRDRPQAVEDVADARQKGDLSENAEYQEARARLSRIQSRIFTLREKLKRARVIQQPTDGTIGLGSTVTLASGGNTATYRIVGPHEADILRNRISHLSPLGAAILNHKTGDRVTIRSENGEKEYDILDVR